MGQQQCCQSYHSGQELILNFNNQPVSEPKQTSAPNRIKSNLPNILLSKSGYKEGVDGQFIADHPLVTESVFHRLETLNSLCSHDYGLTERGTESTAYFKFKRTGIIYVGEWKNGIPTGYGKNYYPNGGVYEGGFLDGIPHGYGRFIMPNGDYYQGQIKYGRACGNGTYTTHDSFYKGSFKDNMRHGFGEQKAQNFYFQGQYEYGQKRKGFLKYSDNTYEGNFLDDLYHGNGVLRTSEGQYSGSFKQGRQHGYGQFKWNNGSVYRGHYNMGIREGQGEYFNGKSSSISKGMWKDGKLNGEGLYIQPRGQTHRCVWKEGKIAMIIS